MAPRRKFDFRFKERVLQFAEQHSGEEAARRFNIDSKRIRYWRKQRAELLLADRRRARLAGGGRKKVNLPLEEQLSDWMFAVWAEQRPLSGATVRKKALEVYPSVSAGDRVFVASSGWLQRFLQRSGVSLRRCPPADQTDPGRLTERLVSFVDHVGKVVRSRRISEEDMIAMDETAVWFGSPLTVVLAARADGSKLKPFVVFRAAAEEVMALRRQVSATVVASSGTGWMNDALTADWLQSVAGRSSPTPRLLVWDSYRCHVSAATTAELNRGYNITAAVIPRGCTRYIQAPDVMWTQTFKQSLKEAYDRWRAGDADREHAAPARRLQLDWVVAAWDKLDRDLIRRSFKVCGLSVKPDGSEDDLILFLREGEPCAAGREALIRLRRRRLEVQEEPEEDEEELFKNELVVVDDEDEEGEEDDNGEEDDFRDEDGDHMSWHCFIHHALPPNNKNHIIMKEEQQDWRPGLNQQDPEPPHIKEEQEELWSNQEGEQWGGLKEEEDEEKPQSSQLHRDCGGPDPVRNSDPDPKDSSETEVSDEDWTETRDPLNCECSQ